MFTLLSDKFLWRKFRLDTLSTHFVPIKGGILNFWQFYLKRIYHLWSSVRTNSMRFEPGPTCDNSLCKVKWNALLHFTNRSNKADTLSKDGQALLATQKEEKWREIKVVNPTDRYFHHLWSLYLSRSIKQYHTQTVLRIRSGSAFHFYTGWIRILLFPLLLIRIRIFLSLWCRSGSGSSAKWCESAPTGVLTLQNPIVNFQGFTVSLHGSTVSLRDSRVSLNGFLDSQHSSWLFFVYCESGSIFTSMRIRIRTLIRIWAGFLKRWGSMRIRIRNTAFRQI